MTPQAVEEQLDALTTKLLLPLRAEKYIDVQALDELCLLVQEQRTAGLFDETISVRLAGKFWFIFWAMIAEAGHARYPDPIVKASWRYQEELRRSFGP